MDLMLAHATEAPPSFTDLELGDVISPSVEQVVFQTLEKNPADRPQSARELIDLYDTALSIEHMGPVAEEVDEVLLDDTIPAVFSQSSGRPCKFGWTSTGRHIIVIWDEANDDPRMVYPITAFEVPPPRQ